MTTFYHHTGVQRPFTVVPHVRSTGGAYSGVGSPFYAHRRTNIIHGQQSPDQAHRVRVFMISIFLIFSGTMLTGFGFSGGVIALGVVGLVAMTTGITVIAVACWYFYTLEAEDQQKGSTEAETGIGPGQETVVEASAPPAVSNVTIGQDYLARPTFLADPVTSASTATADFSVDELGPRDGNPSVPPPSYDEAAQDTY